VRVLSVPLAALAAAAAALTLAAAFARSQAAPPHGLLLTLYARPAFQGTPALRRVVDGPDFDLLALERALPLSFFSARWEGTWRVDAGTYDLHLRGAGSAVLRLDGRAVVARRRGARARGIVRAVPIEAGLHRLVLEYEPHEGPPAMKLLWARQGEPPRALPSTDLFPDAPAGSVLLWERPARALMPLAAIAWAGLAVAVAWPAVRARRHWLPRARAAGHRLRPAALAGLVCAVVAYGAALRFEALVTRYWYDGAPPLAERARLYIRELRPSGLVWLPESDRYGADPFAYLRFARQMRSFYDAHVREPVHLASTRLFLRLLDGRDIGISFASASFSALTVGATYLLGAAVASPAVGLAAAFCLAVERQVIGQSVEGWRDETFAFFVVACAWSLLRLQRHPCFGHALLAGGLGGLAALTRLTSLSFLLPAFAYVALAGGAPRGERIRGAALGLGTLGVVLAPYLLTCAVAFGDPLFAVNYHTAFYRARSAIDTAMPMGWAEYLGPQRHPFRFLDTMAFGLTVYPFANKWVGLDYWSPHLGRVLAAAALGGLALLPFATPGRLFLLVLATSLIPFAFTWDVRGGAEWRFTLHAYPFYLVAAGAALAALAHAASPAAVREAWRAVRVHRVRAAVTAAALAGAVPAVWGGSALVHYLRVREDVRAGRMASIDMGPRDLFFTGAGWYSPLSLGNLTVRCSRGTRATLWLPLEPARAYVLSLRLAPFSYAGAPPQSVRLRLDGRFLAEVPLPADPQWARVHTIRVPARRGGGHSRLELQARYASATSDSGGGDQGLPGGLTTAFLLRFARLSPPSPLVAASGTERPAP
jgi:hypothetical protein